MKDSLENDVKIIEENLRNLTTDQIDGKEKELTEIESLKKQVDEVDDKVKQLEGISDKNADSITNLNINNIAFNERFDKVRQKDRKNS